VIIESKGGMAAQVWIGWLSAVHDASPYKIWLENRLVAPPKHRRGFAPCHDWDEDASSMSRHPCWNLAWAPLVTGLSLSALLHGGSAGLAMDAGATSATILWRAPSRQSLAIQRQLNFVGSVTADSSTQADARSPADIFLLNGTVSLEALTQTLLSAYKDIQYGGIVLRRGTRGELVISNDTTLPGGTILIDRGAQGTAVLHAIAHPGQQQLLDLITPLLK
jgi:hypothetical protein